MRGLVLWTRFLILEHDILQSNLTATFHYYKLHFISLSIKKQQLMANSSQHYDNQWKAIYFFFLFSTEHIFLL